ncbi:MAG: NAD(P)/FAD-dependent oxidoreductase [Candidatus Nanoarchaeia archaeon]|jgi:L-2-hydroxyglutarate oxidase LhgO|nr:NAD(P)/FAD-dependent oxidoreductase [Candidatus Nanoarchaeia archaeon]|tara:strand:- start:47794 stop:48138 length:345 start_codon:yes stop_codon:yes gene_type:complete
MKKEYDIIIIGRGVSGIGCAHHLKKYGKNNFLVITENIGGRICTSKNGKINYGAYYVTEYYQNILKFVKKTKKLEPLELDFNGHKKIEYSLLSILMYPLQFAKLIFLTKKFKRV